ncbi:MAG TPA: hypothetical protein VLL52_22705 [Anaerolineae bacterium]|nr:hypothetical protein [Anaerolineae bacterium]
MSNEQQLQEQLHQASIATANILRQTAISPETRQLSQLTLPEVDGLIEQVAQAVPAGNVPGLILSGLARLPGRRPPLKSIKRDIKLLFTGVEKTIDAAVYAGAFAGPAAVIWGYQNILRLAGKDPDQAFPDGTWQFYVEYALREDTARHTNETHGFDTTLQRHNITLHPVDRLTSWVMAAIQILHQYHHLLQNEWRERRYLALLAQIPTDPQQQRKFHRLFTTWVKQRPYHRSTDALPNETYSQYRQRLFEAFLAEHTTTLTPAERQQWQAQCEAEEAQDLANYQEQLSILSYLDPDKYGETRIPLPLSQLHIGIVHQGVYYRLPICTPGTNTPPPITAIRQQVATILYQKTTATSAPLTPLAQLQRQTLNNLIPALDPSTQQALEQLRHCPIIINNDPRPHDLPLAQLRRAERGVGDHALTIFNTTKTFAFDQSHIYFDGAWGAALAEIMTGEALSWAVYLNTQSPPTMLSTPITPLTFSFSTTHQTKIKNSPQATPEANAESPAIDIASILRLRTYFKQRSDLLNLTVNDILLLYRAIHARTYQPHPDHLQTLTQLAQIPTSATAAATTLTHLQQSNTLSPAILIPVDASRNHPRARLYPLVFEVPINELDFINLHQRALHTAQAYHQADGDRTEVFNQFNEAQKSYLATLASFGTVLTEAKKIALTGESASSGAIKLLAHMPLPLQKLLNDVPDRFELLNDMLKGREVFSNVGAVAPTSSLTRFITAKDDNDKKRLAWGVITNAKKEMIITLRDFRPYVKALYDIDQHTLAQQITQHYLDTYVDGLNQFILELQRITKLSRDTQLF